MIHLKPRILIATTNPGKLDEIRKYLYDLSVDLVGLKDFGITDAVDETGKTFEENAILKAKFYAEKSGLPTLADDGGFEIDALGGEPGVKSHRWVHGDRDSTDEELISYTMERMKDVPDGKRGAQLRTVIAFAAPDGKIITGSASVRGIVPMKPSDTITPGFPYRSLLYLPQIGKFYDHSQLSPEEMDKQNHRKTVLERLKPEIIESLLLG